jgi:uncharacterized membrane protein YsdA (DUF1294 family)
MTEILRMSASAYLVCMTLIGFAVMGIDKHKAIKKGWRIKERTLLLIAFLGGGVGSFLGMYAFRHKTRHIKFVLLIPLAAVVCTAAACWLLRS